MVMKVTLSKNTILTKVDDNVSIVFHFNREKFLQTNDRSDLW